MLAPQKEIKSACSRHHLRLLIGHWLDQASLGLLPQAYTPPMPIATPARPDLDLSHHSAGYLLGELSVHRETFSRGWTGSLAALEGILDALIPVADQSDTRASDPYTTEYQFFAPSPNPHMHSPFIKALADLRRSLMQV